METALFTYEDTTVMSTDVVLLDPPHFLNDRVISFYFDYLTKEIVKSDKIFFLNPSTVFLLSFLEDPEEVKEALGALDLPNRELIFIPVNNNSDVSKAGGSHWSTLIYYRKNNSLFYMDSAGSYNQLAAKRTAEKLTAVLEVKSKPTFIILNTPQQHNGYDCGGFVLSICEEIAIWAKDLIASQSQIDGKNIQQTVAAHVNPTQFSVTMEDTKLSILPYEVIVQILLRVPLASFRAINSTCKYWQSILARREFWKYLSKLVWGEKSTPSSDFASATGKTPVIPGDQLVDWKEYFRIRSKLDGIASIINALQKGFTLNLDADLDTKSDVISNYLRDQMVPDLDEDDAVEKLLKMILSCCDHTFSFSSLGVVWLERLPERYFGGLARHPELMPKIIKITDDILQHSTEENQQHVIEFWSSSCDQELDYREGSESHVPTDNSSLFIGSCCKDLVPLLIRAISDEKYAPTELDEDDWNVRQAAETCLQQVIKVVLGNIVPLVEPILHRDLNSEDWKRRYIALEILGLMLTENHYDYIEKNAASYLLQVLESLRFNHVHVRQSAAWALSKICRSYAKEIKVHSTLLSKAVLEALSDILGVRQYIYACIAHYLSEEAENPFEKDFPRLMEALTACMATSHDNSLALYEAIAALATVQEDSEAIKPLIPIVLQGLKQDINAISVTTALTRKYPEVVVPYVDELYLAHMQEEVTEEALIAIGYTAAAIGEGFTKYLPVLMPFILPLLNNAQNTQMFIGTLGLLGDICGSTKAAIIPYCDTIMQSVLTAVSNPAAHRNVRPEIISLLGDIVLAIGGPAYLRYLPFVLQVLKQAGQVIVEEHDDSNIELEEYIAELRNAWFSALSALFQSYRKNKIAAPPLTELIPLILQAVIGTVNASVNSKNASVAIYVVGDIVQTMEQVLATVRKRNGLNECLNLALGSTDESVVEAATWVLKLLKV